MSTGNSRHTVSTRLDDLPIQRAPAYLVLMDDGQILGCYLDLEVATAKAEAIGGVIAKAPIVADYRQPKP
jgi:hypothetical protein